MNTTGISISCPPIRRNVGVTSRYIDVNDFHRIRTPQNLNMVIARVLMVSAPTAGKIISGRVGGSNQPYGPPPSGPRTATMFMKYNSTHSKKQPIRDANGADSFFPSDKRATDYHHTSGSRSKSRSAHGIRWSHQRPHLRVLNSSI